MNDWDLNLGPTVFGFLEAGKNVRALHEELVKTATVGKTVYQELAQQSLGYQQKLEAANAELRLSGAVYRELQGHLKQVATEGAALEKSFKAVGGNATAAGRELGVAAAKNKEEQQKLNVELGLTRKAMDDQREIVAKLKADRAAEIAQQKLDLAIKRDAAAATREQTKEEKEAAKAKAEKIKQEQLATAEAEKQLRAAGLLTKLRQQLNNLEDAREKATTKGESDGINDQIARTKAQIKELTGSGGSLLDKLADKAEQLPGPLGGVAQGLVSATKASLAFIATPLGVVLAVIAGAVYAVKSAFTSSEEGQNKYAKLMGVVGSIVGNATDLIADFGNVIIGVFEKPKESGEKFGNFLKENITNRFVGLLELIPNVGKAVGLLFRGEFSQAGQVATDAVAKVTLGVEDATNKLSAGAVAAKGFWKEVGNEAGLAGQVEDKRAQARKLERDLLVETEQIQGRIATLRLQAKQEDKFSLQARIGLLKQADQLEGTLSERQREVLKLRADALTLENTYASQTAENLTAAEQAKAAVMKADNDRLAQRRANLGEINELNAKIQAEELRRLKELEAAYKELLRQEKALRKEANQIEIEMLKDQGEAKAKLRFEQERAELAIVEAKMREQRQLAGKGNDLDAEQQKQFSILRAGIADRYYATLYSISEKANKRLFDLQADDEQKAVQAIEDKYEAMFRANLNGQSKSFDALDEAAGLEVDRFRKQSAEEIATEEAKQRELTAVSQRYQQERIEREAAQRRAAAAAAALIFGKGTGQSEVEAKEREKEQILRIDLEKNEKLLSNSQKLADAQGTDARNALREQVDQIKGALKEIEREKESFDPKESLYRLILGEEDDPDGDGRRALEDASKAVVSFFVEANRARLQAADEAINAADKNISLLQSQVSIEVELRRAGHASNLAGLQEALKKEASARKAALAERRKAAREQLIIDTLTQGSSVAVSAANAMAAIPFPFNLLAAAAIVGSFITIKARAFNAASKTPESTGSFFKGGLADNTSERGGYTGAGNPHQVSTEIGGQRVEKRYEYHRAEYVMPHKQTAQHLDFLRALHEERLHTLPFNNPTLEKIRVATPSPVLVQRIAEQRQVAQQQQVAQQAQQTGAIEAKLTETNQKLAEVIQQLEYIDKDNHVVIPKNVEMIKTSNKQTNTKKTERFE